MILLALMACTGPAAVWTLHDPAPEWPAVCRVVHPEDLDR